MKPTGLLPAFEAMNTLDDTGTPEHPILQLPHLGGWITNRISAAYVGDEAARFPKAKGGSTTIIDILCRPRTPVSEDVSYRLPYVPRTGGVRPKCGRCNGDGVLECDLGHEHDCGNCHGDGQVGERGKPEELGQRLYVTGGREILAQARTGALLDGLTPFVLGDSIEDPIAGVDADGDIVVLVMQLRGGPERPAVAA